MTKRLTHKDYTLVLGILVALVIVFALWFRRPAQKFSKMPKILEWKLPVFESTFKLTVKAFEELV